MRTLQEIFDMAYLGLAKQGFERSIKDGSCQYRDELGRKCAIGQCIPDASYSSGFENYGPTDALKAAKVLPMEAQISGLSALQLAHDHGYEPKTMKANLASFAVEFSLTIPQTEGAN